MLLQKSDNKLSLPIDQTSSAQTSVINKTPVKSLQSVPTVANLTPIVPPQVPLIPRHKLLPPKPQSAVSSINAPPLSTKSR